MKPKPCRHCRVGKAYRSRGLCYRCRHTPAVAALYPATRPAAAPTPNFCGPAPPPARPTRARPGTPEKMAVLAGRAARGELLTHPGDAKLAD